MSAPRSQWWDRLDEPRWRWLCLALLLAVSLFAYGNTIRSPLIWDAVQRTSLDADNLSGLPSYFAENSCERIQFDSEQVRALVCYRPITRTAYAVQHALFGGSGTGYHAVSILLNAGVVLLFFLLASRLTRSQGLAFLAALLYAVNPGRGEAVYWVASLSNVIEAGFLLASLLAYSRGRLGLSLLAFGAAMMSRETAVILPAMVLLYEYAFAPDDAWSRRLRRVAPFVALAAAFVMLRTLILGSLPVGQMPGPFTLLNTWAVIVQRFVKLLLFPDAPVAHYLMEDFSALSAEVIISWIVVLAIVAGAIILVRRNQRQSVFWLGWVFVLLSTSLAVGSAGHYLMAEKQLYLAAGGFCLLVAAALSHLRYGRLVIIVVATIQLGITANRTRYWQDEKAHLQQVLDFAPGHTIARYTLGTNLGKAGRCPEAVAHFEQLLARQPTHSMAWNNLGNCRWASKDLDGAAAAYGNAAQADPDNPQPLFNLGLIAERRRDLRTALDYYRRYLAVASDPPPAVVRKIQALEAMFQGSPGRPSGP